MTGEKFSSKRKKETQIVCGRATVKGRKKYCLKILWIFHQGYAYQANNKC